MRKRAFRLSRHAPADRPGYSFLTRKNAAETDATARWAAAKAANPSERYRTPPKEKEKGEGEREGKGEEDVYAAHPCPGTGAYCAGRGSPVDPQRFVDFYTANGWRLGPNPMRTGRRLCAPGSGGARRRRKPIFAGGCMTRQGSKAADGADPGRRGCLLQRRGRRHPAHGHGPVGRRWSSWTPGTPGGRWRFGWESRYRPRRRMCGRQRSVCGRSWPRGSAPVLHPMQERSDPHESEH